MISQDMHLKIFIDGVRGKIFETEIVYALGRVLDDTDSNVRSSAVKFFTAAMVQGALHCFYGILIPKYLQKEFGTRYLRPRSSPHLDVY